MVNIEDVLTTEDVAKIAGVRPGTVRQHIQRGVMPEPDGYLGRTPWWKRKTIEHWLATRRPANGSLNRKESTAS